MADRLITISIRKYLVKQPRTKRARKAVNYLRDRIAHYTKIAPENVRLSQELNTLIFKHYSRRMVPVKVKVKIGTDTADVVPFVESGQPTAAQVLQQPKKEEKKPLLGLKKVEEKKPEQKQASKPAQAAPQPQAKQEKKKPEQKEQKSGQ